MSVLEIKEVVTASIKTAQSAWRDIPTDSSAPFTDFHKTLLNLRADILAVYKIAVLEARRTDSPEEIAEIWREVLAFQEQRDSAAEQYVGAPCKAPFRSLATVLGN